MSICLLNICLVVRQGLQAGGSGRDSKRGGEIVRCEVEEMGGRENLGMGKPCQVSSNCSAYLRQV